ncbi:MAG: hypothetical protein E6K84_07115, partial [Thaumarchaeota archaeon]
MITADIPLLLAAQASFIADSASVPEIQRFASRRRIPSQSTGNLASKAHINDGATVGSVKQSSEARRLEKLRRKIREEGLDGAMMVPGPNLRYYTGVNSLLLERPFIFFVPRDGDPNMVSPSLEAGPYRDCPLEIRIHEWTDNEGPGESFEKLVREIQVSGSWGVEGRVPYLFLHHLMRYASPKFENGEPILQGLRELKDQAELALVRKSASILSKSF